MIGAHPPLVATFDEMGVNAMFGGLPFYFFPLINILFTWVALPVAAIIARRNPVIGLSGSGFLLINGLMHIGQCAGMGMTPWQSPGGVTGIVFLGLFVWIVYACKKYALLPRKGLAIAIISGIIGHICLFSLYIVNLLLGHLADIIWAPFVAFMPLIVSWILCKAFRISFSKDGTSQR